MSRAVLNFFWRQPKKRRIRQIYRHYSPTPCTAATPLLALFIVSFYITHRENRKLRNMANEVTTLYNWHRFPEGQFPF